MVTNAKRKQKLLLWLILSVFPLTIAILVFIAISEINHMVLEHKALTAQFTTLRISIVGLQFTTLRISIVGLGIAFFLFGILLAMYIGRWTVRRTDQLIQALRSKQTDRWQGLFDNSLAAVYVFDAQKRFVDANTAGLKLLGYTRKELMGMSINDVDVDEEAVLPKHKQLLSGKRLVNYEHQLKRKDGTIVTVLNNSCALTDGNDNVTGMQSTLTKKKPHF